MLGLSMLEAHERRFALVCMTNLGWSWLNRSKAIALITQDRILNSEEGTRGLPKAYR